MTALTEVTTLTMSGMLKSPLDDLIKVARDKSDPMLSAFGSTSGGSGAGGSVLVTFEDNTTKAYIDEGSKVTAHDLTVEATTNVKNISIGAAGGKSDKIGFNGTVTVNDIDNTTYAQIINSTATASDKITIKAEDSLYNIDAAGGVTEAGSIGIGVSIAYNKLARDTQASASGALFAADTLAVNAANTGLAVTVSLAGSVTADSPEPPPEPEPEDNSDPVEYVRFLFGEDDDAADPLTKAGEETPSLATKDESGKQAKSGISVAGNVSINMTDETAIASVGGNASRTNITAKYSIIEAKNATSIYAVSGAVGVSANAGGNSTGIGGAFMLNKVNETTQAKADNADITMTVLTATDALQLTATNEAEIVSIAASGGVSPKGAGIAGQVSLNRIDNTTQAGIDNSSITIARPVSVSADDKATIKAVGGAIAYGGAAGFGASVAVNLINNVTDAHVAKSTLSGSTLDSSLAVTATEESKIVSVTAAIGASKGSMAGAFSASGNSLKNTTTAFISGDKPEIVQAIDSQGNVSINAKDAAHVTSIAGAAGVAGGSGVGLGASASVLTTDNTVKAYIGDLTSVKAKEASISAQSEQEVASIAAGGAVGAGNGATGTAGSASISVLKQSNDAHVGKQAIIDASGSVSVNSSNTMNVTGLAGALAIGKIAGVGVATDVLEITSQTAAYIDSGAAVNAKNNVIVAAASTEDVISFAGGVTGGGKAGVAGSASVHVMNTDTAAFIGRVGDTLATQASVIADGSVAVAASDDSTFTGVSGSGGFGGTAGVGASAAVDVMSKTTTATISDYASIQAKGMGAGVIVDCGSFAISYQDYTSDDVAAPSLSTNGNGEFDNQGIAKKRTAESATGVMNGVAVTAVSQNTIRSVAAGASASGTVAATGSAAVNVVSNVTNAQIGKQAKVNTDIAGAAAQSVLVAAASDYAQLGVGGALTGSGSVGVGAGADISVLKNTTKAFIDQNAEVNATKDIQVKAVSSQDIISVAAALGASGNVGVAGAVTANVIDSKTAAYIGAGTTAFAGNNVEVAAKDTTDVVAVAGGAGIGLGVEGVGGSVSVATIQKATEAYIDSGATVDANAQTADSLTVYSGEYDGNGKRIVKQARGISVKADSSEKITTVVVSGGAGLYAGVAGAVAVNVDASTTKAYIGDNAKVNSNNGTANAAQTVNLAATNDVNLLSVSGAAGGGMVGVSGGVDVGIVKNDTSAFVGKGATVNAKGDISVQAMAKKDIASYAASLSGGAVGVAGSVSVYSIGANLSSDAVGSLQAKKDAANTNNPQEDTVQQYADSQIQTKRYADLLSQYEDTNIQKAGIQLTTQSGTLSVSDNVENTTAVPGGTSAFIGANAQLQAGGSLTVKAQESLTFKTEVGAGSLGGVAFGGAVSVVTTGNHADSYIGDDASVSAGTVTLSSNLAEEFNNKVVAGGVGMAGSIAGAVSIVNDHSSVKSYIGKANLWATDSVSVNAKAAHTVTGNVVGASAALSGLSVAGAVLTTTVDGDADAYLGGTVYSFGDVAVQAETVNKLDGLVVAPSAGVFAGGAAVTTLKDTSGAQAFIDNDGKIDASSAVTVASILTSEVKGKAVGVGAGGIAIGAAVADIESSGHSGAYIADNSVITTGHIEVTSDSTNTAAAETTAGSAGLAAAGGSRATAAAKLVTEAYTGNAVNLNTTGTATIAATATPTAKATANGYNFGGLSVGVSLANASVNPSVDSHLGSNNTVNAANLRVAANLVRQAGSNSAYADASASGGGLIGVNATESYATEQSGVISYVGDHAMVTGNLAISAAADTKQTAITSAKTGGIVAVGANSSKATSESTIKSYLDSNANVIGGSGSTVSIVATGTEDTFAGATAGAGGVIAGSAASAKTSAISDTQAYIGSDNDATKVKVDSLALSAQHTSTVNSYVNSLNASVAGGSGAKSANTANSTVATALNGTINTKNLTVKAINNLLRPALSSYHVEAGSGGLLNGAAAREDSSFTGVTSVNIGEGAAITVSGDKRNPGDTVFEALTSVDGRSSVRLTAGGAIEAALAESFMQTHANTGVSVGEGASIDSVGKVTLAAYTTADAQSAVGVNVWGLAGSAKGASSSTITAANTVSVADNAKIRADADINFYAGRSAGGATNVLTAKANTDLYNNTAIPLSGSPKADTSVIQTDSINLATGSSIRSVTDVNLLTEPGTATAVGYGYAQDLYQKALEDVGNAFSNLVGAGDVSLATEYHSATPPVANTAVVIDGLIETGIQNKQVLIIDPIFESDITNFTLNDVTGDGQVDFTVTTSSTEGVSYAITKENVANNMIEHRKELVDLKTKYAADPQAVTAYTADIAYIDSQLQKMGLLLTTDSGATAPIDNYDVYYLTVNDVKASGGNINVTAKNLTGSGSLEAPKDSAITIINNSPLYLRTNQLILDDVGGRVNLNGVEVTSASDITNRNQGGAVANLTVSLPRGASDVAVSKVVNKLKISSIAGNESLTVVKSDPVVDKYHMDANPLPSVRISDAYSSVLYSGTNLKKLFTSAPNIQITDSIRNNTGSVSIYNAEGSILLQGEHGNSPSIVANTVEIIAPNGSVYQSYTPGLTSIGGDPRSLWTESVAGLENTGNKAASNSYSNTVNGKGGIVAGGSVFISGQYLNINGEIQSGIADWSLTLDGYSKYSNTGFWQIVSFQGGHGKAWIQQTLYEFIDAKQAEWEKSGRDPNTKYQITGVEADPPGTIASYYNPSNRKIELGGVTVQGGHIELFGQIMNTGGGSIKALDGYGQINIVNNTWCGLVVNTLDTGNNIHGVVKITDTGKIVIDANGQHYLTTQYQRNEQGKIETTTSYTGLNDATTVISDTATRDVAGGYSPLTGTRYVWTLGQDKMTTTTTNFEHTVGNWDWDPAGWVTNDSTKTGEQTTVGNLTDMPNGAYATVNSALAGTNLYRTYKNQVLNSHTTESKTSHKSGFLGYYKHYLTERVTKVGSQDIFTFSAKADYPVSVSFTGYDAGSNAAINISSYPTIIIKNSLTNRGGEIKLAGKIASSNTAAVIAAKDITLSAGNFGTDIGSDSSPIAVQLLGDTGALTAETVGGIINLRGVKGDLRINRVDGQFYSQYNNNPFGKVTITADGSILQAATGNSAVIRGSSISLISDTGSIGTSSQALNVSVMGTAGNDNINAIAAKDINLRQPNGDFKLGHIESRSGDVTVEAANGSLIDANPIETIDQRTLDQMNTLWDRMQVKQGTVADAANDQALFAYADSKQAAYFDYWRMRKITTQYDDQGNVTGYVSDPYNPQYTYTATASDQAMFDQQGLTAVQKQQYIDNKTQTYLTVGGQLSDAAYDPSYSYIVTDADRASLTSKGWTDSQLKYSISLGIAKQTVSTDTTLQDPNVTGRHVTLIAQNGGVGVDSGELVIDSKNPNVLKDTVLADGVIVPSAARLALADAEGDDITIVGDNIHVALRQAIYVQSDTLEAIGKDHVYIGSANPIYVKNVQSGSGVNGAYNGTIRIKGKAGLYDVSLATTTKASYTAAQSAYQTAQDILTTAQKEQKEGEPVYSEAKTTYDDVYAKFGTAAAAYQQTLEWWNSLSNEEKQVASNREKWQNAEADYSSNVSMWQEAFKIWTTAKDSWTTVQNNLTAAQTARDATYDTFQAAEAAWKAAKDQAALTGGRTVIEAGFSGSLGTQEAPFSIKLAEGAALTARAAGSIFIDSKANDLHLAEVYSEGNVWLRAPGSILTNTDNTVNSVATQGHTITLIAETGDLGETGDLLKVNGKNIIASGRNAYLSGNGDTESIKVNANNVSLSYHTNVQDLAINIAGKGTTMADQANVTVFSGKSVTFSGLQAQNAFINAYTENLNLNNTTIGNYASMRNKYYTVVADPTADPNNLPETEVVLSPKNTFYLWMRGNKLNTSAPILRANANIGTGGFGGDNNSNPVGSIRLVGAAADNDAATVANKAMNTRQTPSHTQQQLNQPNGSGQSGLTGGQSHLGFSPDEALQLDLFRLNNGQDDEDKTKQ